MMAELDWAATVWRFVHVAGMLSLFGTLLARCWLAPLGATPEQRRALRRLGRASLLLALLGGVGWLVQGAYSDIEATSARAVLATAAGLMMQTRFGHRLALCLLALLASGLLAECRRWRPASWLSAVAIGLHAGVQHASEIGAWAWLAQSLHLLAAGAWLGGLAPLALLLRGPAMVAIARRFSMLAMFAVGTLAITAPLLAGALLGGLSALFGSAYGAVALGKMALFAVLLLLAARNRFLLMPRLPDAPMALRRAIGLETLIGLFVVLLASLLASLPPPVFLRG